MLGPDDYAFLYGDQGWNAGPANRDIGDLLHALDEESDARAMLLDMVYQDVAELSFELIVNESTFTPQRAEEAVGRILAAASEAGWIPDAGCNADAWAGFLMAWRPRDHGEDESDASWSGEDPGPTERDDHAPHPVSGAISIGSGPRRSHEGPPTATRGSSSFEGALGLEGTDLADMHTVTHVRITEVEQLRHPERFRAVIDGGRIHTWDGKHVIDGGASKLRYLWVVEEAGLALYLDQSVGPRQRTALAGLPLDTYPSLSSHAQIDGTVACAGDLRVMDGKITYIDNHSGSFQPGGRHYAAAVKYARRLGIVADGVELAQFHSESDGADVDRGRLVALNARAVGSLLKNPE